MNRNDIKMIFGLIALVALARLCPHPWNVTPMGALALFAGAYLPRRVAWLVPAGAGIAVDLIIGLYTPLMMIFVYCAYAASTLIAGRLLRQRRSVHRVGIAVTAGATAFYLISNLGPWIILYPPTMDGLVGCYVNALPFFGRSLLGDGVYATMLFGSFEGARYLNATSTIRHGIGR
jgi:hypothetical protein